jgi:hypothetical protein
MHLRHLNIPKFEEGRAEYWIYCRKAELDRVHRTDLDSYRARILFALEVPVLRAVQDSFGQDVFTVPVGEIFRSLEKLYVPRRRIVRFDIHQAFLQASERESAAIAHVFSPVNDVIRRLARHQDSLNSNNLE